MSNSSLLPDLYRKDRTVLSFELFPPKTDRGTEDLFRTVEELASYQPDFFTCTYGAGGSTRDRTLDIISRVKQICGVPVASHLTCVGATVEELRSYLKSASTAGIDYIVALRGDPPEGNDHFVPVEGGLRYANQLVELIRDEFPNFGIAVAGYPEIHQEAPSAEVDLENLARKVNCGADIVITQLFYDNTDFFRFRDSCVKAGITIPIVPGLLPVLNLNQVRRITSMCKAKLPESFVQQLSRKDDPQWQFEVGVEHAVEQVRGLLAEGVPGIHFYVLNKSDAIRRILESLPIEQHA